MLLSKIYIKACTYYLSRFHSKFSHGLRYFSNFNHQIHHHSCLKLRLHYNELALHSATVWIFLTFADLRWYTLKKSDERDH